MTIDSPKTIIKKSPQEVFHFLSDVKNFEKLMPENLSKFSVIKNDTILFALKGMPEITLQKKEAIEPTKIVYSSADGKLNFLLSCLIKEDEAHTSSVQLQFEGAFNTMMAMMVKNPIKKFIETLTNNLTKSL